MYVDTNDSDVVPSNLILKIDPSIFDLKWYNRIAFSLQTGIGDGLMVGVGGSVQIFSNWLVGPNFNMIFNSSGREEPDIKIHNKRNDLNFVK